jgi:hypothetical protein
LKRRQVETSGTASRAARNFAGRIAGGIAWLEIGQAGPEKLEKSVKKIKTS